MGSQMTERKKSSMIKPMENLNSLEYHRAYRAFGWVTMDWRSKRRTWQIGQATCNHQKRFWYRPYKSSPFDIIVGITARKLDFPDCQLGYDVGSSNLFTPNYERLFEGEGTRTWQFEATTDIHDVQAHHATIKPTSLEYLSPALSAAQI